MNVLVWWGRGKGVKDKMKKFYLIFFAFGIALATSFIITSILFFIANGYSAFCNYGSCLYPEIRRFFYYSTAILFIANAFLIRKFGWK